MGLCCRVLRGAEKSWRRAGTRYCQLSLLIQALLSLSSQPEKNNSLAILFVRAQPVRSLGLDWIPECLPGLVY